MQIGASRRGLIGVVLFLTFGLAVLGFVLGAVARVVELASRGVG